MKTLRPVVDVAINPLAMIRPNRRSGELLACQLLAPAFRRRGRAAVAREFGTPDAPDPCGYAVGLISRPDLAGFALRLPRARLLLRVGLDCLGGGAMTKLDPFLVGIPAAQMVITGRPAAPERVTLIDIAVALDVTFETVLARARREGWIHVTLPGVGLNPRPRRFYRVAGLPADVRDALELGV